jgi:hypothetical protein
MSRMSRMFCSEPTRLFARCLCLVLGCLAFETASACILPTSQRGILFEHVPENLDAPVIAEVTIVSRDANVMLLNGTQIAVLNARVDRVVKGALDSNVLKVITYLDSCSRIGVGHGFVAGRIQRDARRGVELLAIRHPITQARPTNEDKLNAGSPGGKAAK